MLESLMVFVCGLSIGSFCNVVSQRLPVGESSLTPGSHCRACCTPMRPWDNLPLLSYLWLGGRCRACQEPLSLRSPAVELTSGALYVVLWLQLGWSLSFVVSALLTSTLLVVALIDLEQQIIPDRITYPGMVVGLELSAWVLPLPPLLGSALLAALLGLLGGGTFFFVVALLSKGGMGGGDIKLVAMIGAFTGWRGVFVTILVAALTGALVGLALLLLGKHRRQDKVPFGPFLALGAVVYMLCGEEVLKWYVRVAF